MKLENERLRLENQKMMIQKSEVTSSKISDTNLNKLSCAENLKYQKIQHPRDPSRIREVCVDQKGLAQGKYVNYFVSGEVQAKGFMKDGKTNGKLVTFFKTGGLMAEYSNSVDGKFMGDVVEYYESGEKKETFNFENGLVEGQVVEFYKSGEKKEEYTAVKGLPEGPSVKYYENGEVESKGFYKSGNPHGKIKFYSDYGTLLSIHTYFNGVLDGEAKEFYEDGSLKRRWFIDKGTCSGSMENYNKQGVITRLEFCNKTGVVQNILEYIKTSINPKTRSLKELELDGLKSNSEIFYAYAQLDTLLWKPYSNYKEKYYKLNLCQDLNGIFCKGLSVYVSKANLEEYKNLLMNEKGRIGPFTIKLFINEKIYKNHYSKERDYEISEIKFGLHK